MAALALLYSLCKQVSFLCVSFFFFFCYCGLKSFGQNMHANQFSSSFLFLSVEAKRKRVWLWVKKEVLSSVVTKAVEEKMTHTKGKKEGEG